MRAMTVAIDGSGDFRRIQDAVDAVPAYNDEPATILVKNGTYREKLFVEKPHVRLSGEDPLHTVVSYGDYALKTFPDGSKYRTFNTYTAFFGGNDFSAENLTFENTAGKGGDVGQAVAAYVDADRVRFRNCRFLGHQDTLFTGPLPPKPVIGTDFGGPRDGVPGIQGRQYYERCLIRGDVDFIFGSAAAVFDRCEIVSNDLDREINGYVTAPSTPEGCRYGYVFMNCSLASGARPGTVYLGRPWRDFARSVFIGCSMGAHIKPEGWHNWEKPESEATVLFAEYGNSGPGSRTGGRVPWAKLLSKEEAEAYSPERILAGPDGWDYIRG